ncbi:alpha/beta fold hydrolase [Sphingomonas sp.]|uniref:alpha/beta fold hydrolase n=1 Tax=Sphingomonas sp. TaxID=28214 RepID=UPI003B008F28
MTHHMTQVNGVRLHYAEAGEGEPVLLLPGWPQDWYAWRKMVPLLVAQHRRVIVLDPRGYGESDKPASGYDLDTAATDVHGFLAAAGLDRPGGIDVVTHDLGAWIGYALASAHPGDVRRLVIGEVTIPDPNATTPIPDEAANIKSWHVAFNRLPDLPEALMQGREGVFLNWLFDHKAAQPAKIDPAARDEYVRAFSTPGTMVAFLSYYREAFGAAGLKRMGERRATPLPMPVLTVGGKEGIGEMLDKSFQGLATNVQSVQLDGCGHYIPEECPAEFMGAIDSFWRSAPAKMR